MKAKHFALILIPLNLILIFLIVYSIKSDVDFEKDAKVRITENVQKLKDLRQVQIAYKKANHTYANNFESLLYFLENGSIAIVKEDGERPDSLTDAQALELGIISRDTLYVPAKDSVFDHNYKKTREKYPLDLTTLINVPHSEKLYSVNAGMIKKGNVNVQVFEISTTYDAVFTRLANAKNKKHDLNGLLKVGSMDEASLNGNWK